MKKGIVTSLSATVLAAAMCLSPLAVSAAVYGCTEHSFIEIVESRAISWISGDQHEIRETIVKECIDCGKKSEETVFYYENHSYTYDYVVNAWVCECGDSYRN